MVAAPDVKGFGRRPNHNYQRPLRAGVRKPPGKEAAGVGVVVADYGDLLAVRLVRVMRRLAEQTVADAL
jgi:hypothetical protein